MTETLRELAVELAEALRERLDALTADWPVTLAFLSLWAAILLVCKLVVVVDSQVFAVVAALLMGSLIWFVFRRIL